jgi:hypothetical protein
VSELDVDRLGEEILLSSGMVEEAYERYGLSANRAGTYLATFRAVAKRYPHKDARTILADLVETTPGEEGKWSAAAKSAGLFDEALDLARRSPCDPRTLTRAARDFAAKQPAFAVGAGLLALYWLVEGYGYEITRERRPGGVRGDDGGRPRAQARLGDLRVGGTQVRDRRTLRSRAGDSLLRSRRVERPEGSRCQDSDAFECTEREEIAVAAHDAVCPSGTRKGQDGVVVGVAADWCIEGGRIEVLIVAVEEDEKRSHLRSREAELAGENVLELFQDPAAQQELVVGEHVLEELGAGSVGNEGCDEDVRVEDDPQETRSKTSSSLRIPRASASGRRDWRRRRNSRRAN